MKILIDISENHYKALKEMREYGIKLGAYNEAILKGEIISDEIVEKINYLENIWETESFENGWKEGYYKGRQDLANVIVKTLEKEKAGF